MAITPLSWTDHAACRDSEGALFYPADSAERKEERLERELVAKRICASCGCERNVSRRRWLATSPTGFGAD